MNRLSQKLIIAGLYVLILAGPLLGFAAKGFAPMLAIAGTLALGGLLIEKERLKSVDWKIYWPIAPFLVYAFLSCFWTIGPGAFTSFTVMLSVLVFTFSLWQAFLTLPEEKQAAFKSRLSISLLFGIVCALAVGSYPVTYPELPALTATWSNQVSFGNLQLVRQGNRSLSLMPIFLFFLSGYYWNQPRMKIFLIGLSLLALWISFHSESQTSLLALIAGLAFFTFAHIPLKKKRMWLLALTLVGTSVSPQIFTQSFEKKWVEHYLPKTISNRSSARDRQFLYYVFSKETFERPIFGQGLRSSHSFRPLNFDSYYKLAKESKLPFSPKHMRKQGDMQAHPHNVPLQLLFEFGYLGCGLLFLALFTIRNLSYRPADKPFIAAGLAASIALPLFAHSIWQSWLLAALAFAFFYTQIVYSKK